jgi:type IX secretion system PorP/SprF family membrane protein
MKKINYTILILAFLLSATLFAQQESVFTFYKSNMNLVNPAYVGIDNQTLVTSALRKQWTGIEYSPETQAVTFGTPLGKNLGFGISMVHNQTFIEKQTFLGVDFSYQIKMNETTNFYFGLKFGGDFYDINTSGLETYVSQSDPALESIHSFNPNLGVGALLKNEKFYLSLSTPRLLSNTKARNDEGYATTAINRPHFYFSSGYNFVLNASLVVKPSLMVRFVNGAPVSVDLNSMLEINRVFEIGAMYRTDQAYAILSKINLRKRFTIGFAYEMSTRVVMASAKNTNEIFIQFEF